MTHLLFFSEVTRDAHIVTAVTQSGVDGHFTAPAGKRAKYRVHLGNAAVHIDPGNYPVSSLAAPISPPKTATANVSEASSKRCFPSTTTKLLIRISSASRRNHD